MKHAPQTDASGQVIACWCVPCGAYCPLAKFFPSYAARGIARCRTCHVAKVKSKLKPLAAATTKMRAASKSISSASRVMLQLRRQVTSNSKIRGTTTRPRISIRAAQVQQIVDQWQGRSIFSWLGLSPAALRRPTRSLDPEQAEKQLTLVIWRWPQEAGDSITVDDVVPVTKREAHIWRRRPHLFENSTWVQQAIEQVKASASLTMTL